MHQVHLTVTGLVQGVGFRWFASRRARAFGVTGEVRNQPDGAVEIEAEGERLALERFIAAVESGPSGARVDRVEQTWSEGPARHSEFVIAKGSR